MRAAGWLIALLLVVVFPLSLNFDGPSVADPVYYQAGAKALAEGHGYRMVTHLGEPRITHYPPLQSLYLSLFWRMNPKCPDNTPWLHGGMVLLQAVCALLLFLWLKRQSVPKAWAWLLVVTLGTSPNWIVLGAFYFSEPLFLAIALGLLWLWSRPGSAGTNQQWLLTGLGLGLIFLVRPAALGLIAGVGCILFWMLWKEDRKPLFWGMGPVGLVLLGWKWWCMESPGHTEETALRWHDLGAGGTITMAAENALGYLGGSSFLDLMAMVFVRAPGISLIQSLGISMIAKFVYWTAALSLVVVIFRGMRASNSSVMKALGVIAAVYAVQIIVYPWHMGNRAIVVLLPLLLLWLWRGLEPTLRHAKHGAKLSLGLAAVLAANIATNCYLAAADARTFQLSNSGDWEAIDQWLAQNVKPDSLVAASSTLPLIRFHESASRKFAEDDFPPAMDFVVVMPGQATRPKADYLVASEARWRRLQSFNGPSGGRFSVAYSPPHGQFLVLRVDQDMPQHGHPTPNSQVR